MKKKNYCSSFQSCFLMNFCTGPGFGGTASKKISPSQNDQKLNVLIETEKGQKVRLCGIVKVNALD